MLRESSEYSGKRVEGATPYVCDPRLRAAHATTGLAPMVRMLERLEALVASPTTAPEDLSWPLSELGRLLDPELTAPSPQSSLIFARALDLAALRVESDGPALAEFLLSVAKYAYVSGHALKGL